jgi:hypothetical protein
MAQTDEATMRRYLQMFQDNPGGTLQQAIVDTLRRELENLWRKVMRAPNTYIMTPLEAKLFNAFRADLEARNPRVVQRALQRYWDNNSTDGTT